MKFDYEYRKMVKASLLMGLLCPIAAVSLLILVPNKVVGRIGGFILVELLYAVILGISLLKKAKSSLTRLIGNSRSFSIFRYFRIIYHKWY